MKQIRFSKKIALIVAVIATAVGVMWGVNYLKDRGIGMDKLKMLVKSVTGKRGAEKAAEELGQLLGAEEGKTPVPVKTAGVGISDYLESITSFGTIKGFGEIPIKFKESGAIDKFFFKEGDRIRKGALVVSQDKREQNLKLEYSRIEYEKNKKLFELGAITKYKLRQTELETKTAELDIEKRHFYAPTHGFMGTRKVNEGEMVEPNDVVATFLDINNVFCEVGIIERDIGQVSVGQKARVYIDAIPGQIFEGVVDSVSPMIEGRSRTQTVKILIPNRSHLIKPGMFAKAEITIFESKNGIVVPSSALKKTDQGYVAFGVARPQEKELSPAGYEMATAAEIAVGIARQNENSALIEKGLFEGQEIVIESPMAKEKIEDGSKIEIINEE